MRLRNKKVPTIIGVIAVVVIIIVIVSSRQKPLPSYNGAVDKPTEPATEEPVDVESFLYTDKETGFSVKIPEGWQEVTKSGYPTFIHAPSATSVQIQVKEYDPQIVMTDATSVSTDMIEGGFELNDFYWADNSTFVQSYKKKAADITDYYEVTMFDRAHIIDLIYTVNEEYYDRMKEDIGYSIDSIKWEREEPIPQEFKMYYSESGDFEFPIPINWESGLVDGAFYANDPNTKASYTITIAKSDALYNTVSEIDYVGFASTGRNGFILQSFASSKSFINATATYMSGDTKMMLRQYMVATGTYEYNITEECPMDTYDSVSEQLEDVIKLFRIFDEEAENENGVFESESSTGIEEGMK